MKKVVKNKILILYHFFYPDDVVSSRHFSDLALGLCKNNWDVTVYTSNRYCRNSKRRIKDKYEVWKDIKINRFTRPAFNQKKHIPRLLNSFIISIKWLLKIIFSSSYDVVFIGTDPQFCYLIIPFIKLFKRRTKIVYWGFDLYPEAIISDSTGLLKIISKSFLPLTKFCYKYVNLFIDIGSCMKKIFKNYHKNITSTTVVPWALVEPGKEIIHRERDRAILFGKAKLGILYSGTIGKAHEFNNFIKLAHSLRNNHNIHFCFAGQGNRYNELKKLLTPADTNISMQGFVKEEELLSRLNSADFHLISLKKGWEGIVVPSKFYGSLAIGKPLIYSGSPLSSIKTLIDENNLGYCLNEENISDIKEKILSYVDKKNELLKWNGIIYDFYQSNYAKDVGIRNIHNEILKVLS